jgi:hypothetical protein
VVFGKRFDLSGGIALGRCLVVKPRRRKSEISVLYHEVIAEFRDRSKIHAAVVHFHPNKRLTGAWLVGSLLRKRVRQTLSPRLELVIPRVSTQCARKARESAIANSSPAVRPIKR